MEYDSGTLPSRCQLPSRQNVDVDSGSALCHDSRMSDTRCYVCDRPVRRNGFGVVGVGKKTVLTVDGERQFVGPDCYRRIVDAGPSGYQPPLGGPRLYDEYSAPPETLAAAGITITYNK